MTETNATYQYGELVDITIRGARVDHCADRSLYIQVPGADAGSLIPLGSAVTVNVVQPADGPALPGDVWRTPAGVRWFAYEEQQYGKPVLFLTNGELRGFVLSEICESFGTPVLEFRTPLADVEQDAKTIVAEALRPNPLAELLPDTGGWDNDLDVCPSCRKPYSPSWSSHCETCHGPRRVVSGGAA